MDNSFLKKMVWENDFQSLCDCVQRTIDNIETILLWQPEGDELKMKHEAFIQKFAEDKGILATKIMSDGRYDEQLFAPGGGSRNGWTPEVLENRDNCFKMRGNELFKVAVRSMSKVSKEMLEKTGYTVDDVKMVIPHQANQRITDAVASRLKVPEEKVYSNIAEHGNTSAASIPIALDECLRDEKIVEGDLVLMTAFGGGVTWGGTLVRF